MQRFEHISYLKQGNKRQQAAYQTLVQHRVMEKLAPFSPLLAGTIPIAIDVATSDLDIICCCASETDFEEALQTHFGTAPGFSVKQVVIRGRESIVANCRLGNFDIEFLGSAGPRASRMLTATCL